MAIDDLLSQDEIDMLLRGGDEGDAPADDADTLDASRVRPTTRRPSTG